MDQLRPFSFIKLHGQFLPVPPGFLHAAPNKRKKLAFACCEFLTNVVLHNKGELLHYII